MGVTTDLIVLVEALLLLSSVASQECRHSCPCGVRGMTWERATLFSVTRVFVAPPAETLQHFIASSCRVLAADYRF